MFRIFRQLGSIRQRRTDSAPPRLKPTVEALEDRLVPAFFSIANFDVPALIAAITSANTNGQADTINLAPGGSYILTEAGDVGGQTGLPFIEMDGGKSLTINGNGATILRAPNAPNFRIVGVAGTLTLDGITIANGNHSNFGGGISVTDGGHLTLSNSSVVNNAAAAQQGGGIAISTGSATLINCTVSGNSAPHGGGISQTSGRVFVFNSTIANNTSSQSGGGIEVGLGATALTLESTVVADNTAPQGNDLFRAAGTVNAIHSLIENPQAGAINGTNKANIIGQDPKLGPLQNNGGPTPTHALLAGSPAQDQGSNLAGLPFDQRGFGFARVKGAAADIGAFETDLIPGIDLSVSMTNNQTSLTPGQVVTYTLTVRNNGSDPANGASFSAVFPAALTGVTYTSSASGGANGNTSSGTGNIADTVNLPAGGVITYTATGTVAATASGTLSITATVVPSGGLPADLNPADNTATDTDTIPPPTDDLGDAPTPFPTLLANDGARHRVVPGFHLGGAVDTERDGQPHPFATGDDLGGGPDDEDGVMFTTALAAGQQASVTVTASQPGLLHAWIDFNNNGDWEAGEQVFANRVLAAGPNALTFPVPSDAVPSDRTFARFRFGTEADLQPTGPAADGEVEDHVVAVSSAPPPGPSLPEPSATPLVVLHGGRRKALPLALPRGIRLLRQRVVLTNPNGETLTGQYRLVLNNLAGGQSVARVKGRGVPAKRLDGRSLLLDFGPVGLAPGAEMTLVLTFRKPGASTKLLGAFALVRVG